MNNLEQFHFYGGKGKMVDVGNQIEGLKFDKFPILALINDGKNDANIHPTSPLIDHVYFRTKSGNIYILSSTKTFSITKKHIFDKLSREQKEKLLSKELLLLNLKTKHIKGFNSNQIELNLNLGKPINIWQGPQTSELVEIVAQTINPPTRSIGHYQGRSSIVNEAQNRLRNILS